MDAMLRVTSQLALSAVSACVGSFPPNTTDATGSTTGGASTSVDVVSSAVTLQPDDTSTSSSPNLPPVVLGESYLSHQGAGAVSVEAPGLLSNDADPEGEALVAGGAAVSLGGGSVVISSDGSFVYTPPDPFWGEDFIEYVVADAQGNQAMGTARRVVRPVEISMADVAQGRGGFVIDGEEPGDEASWQMSGGGDVNADGLGDIVVGARLASPAGAPNTGKAYVVFGKDDTAPVDLGVLGGGGGGGFALEGEASGGEAGRSSGIVGDMNGDGFADVVVGAHLLSVQGVTGIGRTYVVFGKDDSEPVMLADIADGSGGFRLDGELGAPNGWAGQSVGDAGDVNGDGTPDIVIGALYVDPGGMADAGKAYVVFGKSDTTPVDLGGLLAKSQGFEIVGQTPGDQLGWGVSRAGDVNGDGLFDVAVGAPSFNSTGVAGRSYVIFGRADSATVEAADVLAGDSQGFMLEGETANDYANRIGNAGDVNGDGFSDVIIGAYRASPNGLELAGKSYVVFGGAEPRSINLTRIAQGRGGFVIVGAEAGDWSGISVGALGDINSDGYSDVFVGAYYASPAGLESAGRCYVVYGKPDTNPILLAGLPDGDGEFGFVLSGAAASDGLGWAVGPGDMNGDGRPDVVVGAADADPNGKTAAGRAYVVFGVPSSL